MSKQSYFLNKTISFMLIFIFFISANFFLDDRVLADSALGYNQEGAILHAWCWRFKDVTQYIHEISDAGYTSIQVSPVQLEKKTDEFPKVFSSWWAFYQPLNFKVGNSLGNREEFKEMCDSAHKKNLKIIVDVVSNHLANNTGIINGECDYCLDIDPEILSLGIDEIFHHEKGRALEGNSRKSYTQRSIGMPDLNTANKDVQNIIIKFLDDLLDLGADGFRFDAAKHIELPKEFDGEFGSDFWPTIINAIKIKKPGAYIYGELLNDNDITNFKQYLNFMNVTDSKFGENIIKTIIQKKILYSGYYIDIDPSNLVTWVETHDTYAEGGRGPSFDLTDDQIKLGWSMVASRAKSAPLFLSRPSEDKIKRSNPKDKTLAGMLGGPGNLLWKDDTIVEINKFRKKMYKENEYIRKSGNHVLMIERGNKGIVISNIGDETERIKCKTLLINGHYIDKISGKIFKVRNGELQGEIDAGQIAILYDPEPKTFISQKGGFFKDKIELNIGFENADYATYILDDGDEIQYEDKQKLVLGEDISEGGEFKLTLNAYSKEKKIENSFIFQKKKFTDQAVVKLMKQTNWEYPYIYIYADEDCTFRELKSWPGVPLDYDLHSECWFFNLPNGWNSARIVVSEQLPIEGIYRNTKKEKNFITLSQIPLANEPGYLIKLGNTLVIYDSRIVKIQS